MTGATLFSGIGAPETAMPSWRWLWHAEIEKFPSAVMAARHPQSVNLGDVTAHDFCDRALAVGCPDVLVFGSPCQSFSVAGKRLGLDDPRGNLAFVALGIVDRLRRHGLRWFVFENVPGLLSSSSGRDFGLFLRTVDELGAALAWTVLDAQYRRVAQRRRRVFAVGCFGDWRGPAAVLFEPHSLQGHSAPRREAGQGITCDVAPCVDASGVGFSRTGDKRGQDPVVAVQRAFGGNNQSGPIDTATARNASASASGRMDFESETFIVGTLNANGKAAGSATQQDAETGMLVAVFDPNQITSKTNRSQPGPGLSHSLPAKGNAPIAYAIGSHASCADGDQTNRSHASGGPVGLNISEEVGYSIRAGRSQAVAFNWNASPAQTMSVSADATDPLRASHCSEPAVQQQMAVRRLMPIETERLQGFSDGYTAIEYRKKPAADGPRYKAIGNSMAVPVIRLVLERIEQFEQISEQIA